MKNLRKGLVFSLVLLSVISLGSVAGTYAKYTSNATGTDSARVAKWSFTVGGTETATTDTFTFNLFETTYTNVASKDLDGDGNNDKVIAPGTEGSFDIVLANASEVNATYDIEYTVTNTNNIPVEFSVDGGTTWKADLTTLNVDDKAINMNGGTETIKVQWRWAFEGTSSTNFTSTQTDATDTALGKDASAVLTVSAKVTATQVD